MTTDVIIDTLDTLIELLERNGGVYLPAHRTEAERIARAAWGGERPYVGKRGECGQGDISQRDRAIRRDFARGAPVPVLARRYGVSERRARAIVQPERAQVGPAEAAGQAILAADPAASCLTGGRQPDHAARHRKPPAERAAPREPTTP